MTFETVDVHATYLGGHPQLPDPDTMNAWTSSHLVVDSTGVVYRKKQKQFFVGAQDVRAVRLRGSGNDTGGAMWGKRDKVLELEFAFQRSTISMYLKMEGMTERGKRHNVAKVVSAINLVVAMVAEASVSQFESTVVDDTSDVETLNEVEAVLERLMILHQKGLITAEDYQEKKGELLARL